MIVRVDSLEGLSEDVALYFGKNVYQLTDDLKNFQFRNCDDFDVQNNRLRRYIRSNKRENITEVFLCHISRQIGQPSAKVLLPLPLVLTGDNSLSLFLKKHGITCYLDCKDLVIQYNGKPLDVRSLKGRLHNRLTFDYCINGFQFLYDIKNTNGPDFRWYGSQPEFLYDLDQNLGLNLCNDFQQDSSIYCALGRLSMTELSYCSNKCSMNFEEDYIFRCLHFLWEYLLQERPGGQNSILYASDTQITPIDRWIHESDIPLFEDTF